MARDNRFRAYREGFLSLEEIVNPDTGYFYRLKDLGLKIPQKPAEMEDNWIEVRKELLRTGRKFGDGQKRKIHKDVYNERSLAFKGEPNSSVDLYDKNRNLKQRRFYDEEGYAEYDIDYNHGEEMNHIFPHRHYYFRGDLNKDLTYKDRSRPVPDRSKKNVE